MKRRRTTMLVLPTTPVMLQEIAGRLAMTHDRGPAFGSGSASQLLDALSQAAFLLSPDYVAEYLAPLLQQAQDRATK